MHDPVQRLPKASAYGQIALDGAEIGRFGPFPRGLGVVGSGSSALLLFPIQRCQAPKVIFVKGEHKRSRGMSQEEFGKQYLSIELHAFVQAIVV